MSVHRHLAIVPAYNEAGAIADTVRDIRRHSEFDVLVVDDGSTDETTAAARRENVPVIRHPFNLGIGGAVQSGYQYALEHDYEVAVQVDGDGQHDARHLPEMLALLRQRPELNMVTGSRFLFRAAGGYRSSVPRRFGIRLFAEILSVIVGRRVTDATSGYRMVGRRGIELFARDYPHDYPEVEAILLLHHHHLEGMELPVEMRPRTSGCSSITPRHSMLYMVKVLLAILVGLLRARPAVEQGDRAPVSAEPSL